jgi:AraC-like DNA-binding protein
MTGEPDNLTDRPRSQSVTTEDTRPTGADPFRVALERVHLQGAVFLRAEYREPWAYVSLTGEATAQLLAPGSDRVLLFHVVAAGKCWVSVDSADTPWAEAHRAEKHWAEAGDVIVLPYGDQHRMGGVKEDTAVSITAFLPAPPWRSMPVLRHGKDGVQTDVVCGYLLGNDPLFDPALRAFPPVFVVRPQAGPVSDWVRANIAFAMEQTAVGGPAFGVSTRLPEMLLIEVLRLHLAGAPAADAGWMAALRDPVLRPALADIHRRPEYKWTVSALAARASVSRSLLDERFRLVLRRSPIRYLTDWRMHIARDLLTSTDLSVQRVAHRVGYDAEEAFSRAFKRQYGSSPAAWRRGYVRSVNS